MQYLVRGTYQRETTVFPGNFSDQKRSIYFSINSTSANQKFNMQLSGSYLFDNNQLPAYDFTKQAIFTAPNAPNIYNADGTLNWMPTSSSKSTWQNPFAKLHTFYQNKSSSLTGNAVMSCRILPDLELRSSFGYNNIRYNEISLDPLVSIPPDWLSFSLDRLLTAIKTTLPGTLSRNCHTKEILGKANWTGL